MSPVIRKIELSFPIITDIKNPKKTISSLKKTGKLLSKHLKAVKEEMKLMEEVEKITSSKNRGHRKALTPKEVKKIESIKYDLAMKHYSGKKMDKSLEDAVKKMRIIPPSLSRRGSSGSFVDF